MRFVCRTDKGVCLKDKQTDHVVEAATHGEAKHQFKKVHGITPDRCKGTRKRLPLGYRVRQVD